MATFATDSGKVRMYIVYTVLERVGWWDVLGNSRDWGISNRERGLLCRYTRTEHHLNAVYLEHRCTVHTYSLAYLLLLTVVITSPWRSSVPQHVALFALAPGRVLGAAIYTTTPPRYMRDGQH